MVDRLGVKMKDNIKLEIQKRINALSSVKGYEFFGAFLYGSQNYNLDTESSDVDLVVLYIPTAEKLVNLAPPLSKEETLAQTNEKNVLKDIRLFIKELLKGSPNALEILYTDNFLINSKYLDLWEGLKDYSFGFFQRKIDGFLKTELGIMYNVLKTAKTGIFSPKSAKRIWHSAYIICNTLTFKDYNPYVYDSLREDFFKSLENFNPKKHLESSKILYYKAKEEVEKFLKSWEYPKGRSKLLEAKAYSFLKEAIFYDEK